MAWRLKAEVVFNAEVSYGSLHGKRGSMEERLGLKWMSQKLATEKRLITRCIAKWSTRFLSLSTEKCKFCSVMTALDNVII